MRKPLALTLAFLIMAFHVAMSSQTALSKPSSYFTEVNGEVFDEWGICRTSAFGERGYFRVVEVDGEVDFKPIIAYESLGRLADIAYQLGAMFAEKYSDKYQLAEAIFDYVKQHVRYTPDVDQFNYEEFALNADELAKALVERGIGYGDCEDYALLLAIMFKGAGLRSAIVLAPGHAATLVYLPGYDEANVVWKLNGEEGWVWAEATSRRNRLGWTPLEFTDCYLLAYEVVKGELKAMPQEKAAVMEVAEYRGGGGFHMPPFFTVLLLMWFISRLARFVRRRPLTYY